MVGCDDFKQFGAQGDEVAMAEIDMGEFVEMAGEQGRVVDYKLRQRDPKRASVQALHSLNYRVIAAGDSYNDTTMLAEADVGFLIHAPQNVIDEFPQFKPVDNLEELKLAFVEASDRRLAQ